MEEKIFELIKERNFSEVKKELSEMNPADIAVVLNELSHKDLPLVFRILPKEAAAEAFVELDTDMQQYLIESFSDKELKEVFDELFMDDTVDIIEEMPASVAKRILKQTDAATRKMINQILAYPDDTAGSLMTTEYIDVKRTMTVEEALDRIREVGFDAEVIYICYVIDRSRHLLGYVTLRDLLLRNKTEKIADIMEENVISAQTLEEKEEVAAKFEKYDFLSLPVVDKENRLVGVITVDDAIDVIQEVATEDMGKMAAVSPTDKPYLKTGVFSIVKARIPWLMLLMLSATVTGAIISSFEAKLTVVPALIAFIPMLMGTAGNSGNQSSVTIIRSLSLGDIEFEDILKVIWKETRVALICSIALAVVNFGKLWLVDYHLLKAFDAGQQIKEIAVVCITQFFTVIVSKLVGCALPMVAKKIGFDPAVMASPFITTILDAVSLVIYFAVAVALLGV